VTENDLRVARARDSHQAAAEKDAQARAYRDTRDRLIRELRAEDPSYWTLGALAREIGCSKELIAHIVKQEESGGG
jgi:AraC-like DNA-binding protein